MSSVVGLRLELNYSREVLKRDTTWYYPQFQEWSKVEAQNRLNYINIPILFSMSPASWISFHVGPQAGLLINNRTVIETVSARIIETVDKALNISFVFDMQFNITRWLSIY